MLIRWKCTFTAAGIRCTCRRPGLYTKVQPLVRQPMDRVFFANTDSEGPVSSTDAGNQAARRAVKEVGAPAGGRSAQTKQTAIAAMTSRHGFRNADSAGPVSRPRA